METRARYILIGLFTAVVILAGFGFVYWLQNDVGMHDRETYKVRFEGPASGLRTGASVLYNGIHVGEVTGLSLESSGNVVATIGVDRGTPLRADTKVAIEVQGLMGSASISLRGGSPNLPVLVSVPGTPAVLVADPDAGQDVMQMARRVLGRVDTVVGDNSAALHDTIGNIKTFSDALARNSDHVDAIMAGLDKLAGGAPAPVLSGYQLDAPDQFPASLKAPQGQLTVAEPTALIAFDTQKILLSSNGGESPIPGNGQWADNLPKLFQAKIIQSFENANFLKAVARPIDGLNSDFQLLLDIRNFEIVAEPVPEAQVAFTAKILAKSGEIVAAHLFKANAPAKATDAASAAAALNEAFGKTATELVNWATGVM
jgi:phospholipid/cholesterol/gamma-HCH transport system substrate-binding protein